jgi:predicted amidophosphoribosyltransferase
MTSPSWSCYRCLTTTGRATSSDLCAQCRATLAASGLGWCCECKAAGSDVRFGRCRACKRAKDKQDRNAVPRGYISARKVASRIGYSVEQTTRRLRQGWLGHVAFRIGPRWYLPDWPDYPLWEAWKR